MKCSTLTCITIPILICVILCFFFSSRRRHTRCLSDWSSDVCSSDLENGPQGRCLHPSRLSARSSQAGAPDAETVVSAPDPTSGPPASGGGAREGSEIGRASCRERVKIWVVAGAAKEEDVRQTRRSKR